MSVEIAPAAIDGDDPPTAAESPARGRSMIADARGLVAGDDFLFAAVSPGNARSLRAFLAAEFRPIGSEVIIARAGAVTD